MQLDDRLATVLRFDASNENARRNQYRQLLDLLGRRKEVASRALLSRAYSRLAQLVRRIPAPEQAQIIKDPGLRLRNPLLIAALSETEPQIAAAALARAELSAADWDTIIAHIPVRARGLIRLRRDLPPSTMKKLERLGVHDRALPMPSAATGEGEAGAKAEAGSDKPTPPAAQSESDSNSRQSAQQAASNGQAASRIAEAARPGKPAAAMTAENGTPRRQRAGEGDRAALATMVAANDLAGEEPGQAKPQAQKPGRTRPSRPAMAQTAGDQSEISALVERIENYQHNRTMSHAGDSPPLPLDERFQDHAIAPIHGFSFSCDANGQVDWAEPDVMPMVYGLRLFDRASQPLIRCVRRQQPLRSELLTLSGARAIAGEWVLDAAPRFTQPGGRFFGYAGRMRRPAADEITALAEAAGGDEHDRIGQLLHELRTPVNAIQGFAEVIQQQLFGPASHEYRALAANIASDAARMLAGFDEMDRLVKLETGAAPPADGAADLAAIMRKLLAQLADVLAVRSAAIEATITPHEAYIALDDSLAQSLAWRLLATLAGAMGAGENRQLAMTINEGRIVIRAELPQALADRDDIFAASNRQNAGALSSGVFGAGFALRLVRAEAQALGGRAVREENWLILETPLLTGHSAANTDDNNTSSAHQS